MSGIRQRISSADGYLAPASCVARGRRRVLLTNPIRAAIAENGVRDQRSNCGDVQEMRFRTSPTKRDTQSRPLTLCKLHYAYRDRARTVHSLAARVPFDAE